MTNEKLRKARKDRYWTIEYVCSQTGVSERAYRSWEQGTHKPNLSSLGLICKFFDLTPVELGFEQLNERSSEDITTEEGPLIRLTRDQVAAITALVGERMLAHMDATKRRTLKQLVTLIGGASLAPVVGLEAWERLTVAPTQPTALNADTLQHFESLLATCWRLSNSGELDVAESVLPSFLPKLVQLAPHQETAASLAARGLQLNSILTAHRLQLSDKITLCKQSVETAKLSQDHNVIVTALTELAVAYRYDGQLDDALRTCQENLYHCERATSPLVRARAYSEAALAFAINGRYREANFYLGFAYDSFPANPAEDPHQWYADSGHHTLILRDLLIKITEGQGTQAWDLTTAALQSAPTVPERNRLEIINHLSKAAILQHDLEKYVACLQDGLQGAIALKSSKRFNEARAIFLQEVPPKWRKSSQLKDLADQYKLLKG